MKIGILSFWWSQDNYGQILQCYALQQFLIKMGHSPEHIKSYAMNKTMLSKIKYFCGIVLHGDLMLFIKSQLEIILKGRRINEKSCQSLNISTNINRGFDNFRNNNLVFSGKVNNYNDLDLISEDYDALIVGSDLVWGNPNKLYCLGFGPNNTKRIAFAASMGGKQIRYRYQKYLYNKYLRRFSYISLREEDGVEEIKKIGFPNAKCVLDPSFLLNANDYRILYNNTNVPNDDYLFLYLLGTQIDVEVNHIYSWAKSKGLKVIYVASKGRNDNYPHDNASIEQWLNYIDNAKYVITNSFHGIAFCIIFRKQFLFTPLSGLSERLNKRIYCILRKFKIDNRVYKGNFDEIGNSIDYSIAKIEIEKNIEKSENDIRRILK